MKHPWLMVVLWAIGFLALAGLLVFPEPAIALLFGWAAYLNRVLPAVRIRWDGMAIFVLGLMLFAWLSHRLFSWLRREMSEGARSWRWRSTGLIVGLVMLMFVAGIAMIGVTHQTAWLTSDREPIFGPALPHYDPRTKRNELKQLDVAVYNFYEIADGFPASIPLEPNQAVQSWATQILSYTMYYPEFDLKKPWNHPINQAEAKNLVPMLLNPDVVPLVLRDDAGYGVTHYAGNRNLFDVPKRVTLEDISDGPSNTLMIGEIAARFPPWAKPRTGRDPALGINRSPDGFGSPSATGDTFFLMADGSVKVMARGTAPEVIKALGTPQGNEHIEE